MSLLRFLKANPVAICLLFVAVASAVFLVFPGIDLWFSDLFYRSRSGFWLRRNDALGFLRATNDALIAVAVVALIASLVVKLARPEKPSPIRPNTVVFLLSTLRPRLRSSSSTSSLRTAGAGRGRCRSISSAATHPMSKSGGSPTGASGTARSSPGKLRRRSGWSPSPWCCRRRCAHRRWLSPCVYALLLSLNRIAFGGHFLSDVVISFGLTLLVIAVMHRVVIERPPKWLSNETLETGLTRARPLASRTKERRGNGLRPAGVYRRREEADDAGSV